jgi:hypothetical protein
MWIPILLDKNIEEMQKMGFQLSSEDIYSINKASMKDAIVLFGRGCTGELISTDGLLITNHHCGYGQIQSHSSLEHDYLTDGFWAMNRKEELPNEDLSVTFLVEMRDVTNEVLQGTDSLITENGIEERKRENIAIIKDEATENTHYHASVKPFFEGNQYFLFITEKFTDVRLVGTPPSAIGKFGGDTDNWMWPRHTGDFSMFRIYADSTNQPAEYSPDNVPYHPKKHFPINISGINEGDFTMVFGYPGSTHQYLHSDALEQTITQHDPDCIAIRDVKLNILRKAMEADRGTRIKYSAKYASTSNSWKKWQGEIKGLIRLNAVQVKRENEKEFSIWVEQNPQRKYNYGTVLSEFEKLYIEMAPYQKAKDYYDEIVVRGTDTYKMYKSIVYLINSKNPIQWDIQDKNIDKHFRNYEQKVDQSIFTALIKKYNNDIDAKLLPDEMNQIFSKKEANKYLSKIYKQSPLNNSSSLKKIYSSEDLVKIKKKIKKDPLFKLFEALIIHYSDSIAVDYYRIKDQIDRNQKIYMTALLEQNEGKMLFPDANLTLRVTYGQVEGYQPADGVSYKHYTTLKGIIAKDNPEIYDYDVPDQLKELYKLKDYGSYANALGELPICFTASNHTTGGNSGSPVIDANGYLIGINFDRCWEGTMSDLMFDGEKCRNIALDMRYMLFLIDKFAGAGYLIDEMEIIK